MCLTNTCIDDLEMSSQLRKYARGIVLVCNFSHWLSEVKHQLFRAYCYNFYCSQLWCTWSFKKESPKQLRVAFNTIFHNLFNIKGQISISNKLLLHSLDHLNIIHRKLIVSFIDRILVCDNKLIQTIFNSWFFLWW